MIDFRVIWLLLLLFILIRSTTLTLTSILGKDCREWKYQQWLRSLDWKADFEVKQCKKRSRGYLVWDVLEVWKKDEIRQGLDKRSIGDLLVSFFSHRCAECSIMVLFEEMFPLIPWRLKKKKKKGLYKLNGSHWSRSTHSVKKLHQRREQQKFRLQFCGASKQTFFFLAAKQPPKLYLAGVLMCETLH